MKLIEFIDKVQDAYPHWTMSLRDNYIAVSKDYSLIFMDRKVTFVIHAILPLTLDLDEVCFEFDIRSADECFEEDIYLKATELEEAYLVELKEIICKNHST